METVSLQLGAYFYFISGLNIYNSCKIVDGSGNLISGLSGFTLSANNCNFTIDKSIKQPETNVML